MTDTMTCARCGQEVDASENGCPACGNLQQGVPCIRHADRTATGQCVICGDAVCDTCNSTEPHFTCETHADIPVFEGWAQIYSTSEEIEAQLICENLRAEGIDSEVLSQRDQTFRLDLGDLAPVRVLVPAFDFLSADEVVSGHMDPSGEVVFACEACGEPYEAGQTRCTSCDAALPGGATVA